VTEKPSASPGGRAALIAKIRQAATQVERLERELETARQGYLRAIQTAHDSGLSMAAIGAELGISRQRVRQLLDAGARKR
jgi:DNA-directed RNA polymerase sigma subunit (sigma70/sigma32)